MVYHLLLLVTTASAIIDGVFGGQVLMKRVASTKSACCNTLLLRSNGGLAQGMQKHLLGQYFRDDSHDGEEGTMVYKQVELQ